MKDNSNPKQNKHGIKREKKNGDFKTAHAQRVWYFCVIKKKSDIFHVIWSTQTMYHESWESPDSNID